MKRNICFQRAVSVFLMIAITLCLLPVQGVGTAVGEDTLDATAQVSTGFTEVTSLREEYVKHYSLGDGTYQAVAYGRPVHYLDENGTWQDIDNSLTLQTVNGVQKYSTANSRVAFRSSFAANTELMSIQDGDYGISMSLVSNSDTSVMAAAAATSDSALVTNANRQITNIDQAIDASWSSSLVYRNALPNVDLEYIVDYDYVKENIIVKAPMAAYDYTFRLTLDGMYATLLGDGSVGIYCNETDEEKYVIPTPYMYDANGVLSLDVTYSLSGASGKYILTVNASEDWINDADRAFPVTIDPTYVVSTTTVHDTYIDSNNPDDYNGNSTTLWVSEDNITYIRPRTNITLPNGALFVSAFLTLDHFYAGDIATGTTDVAVYQVKNYWSESSLCWDVFASEVVENMGMADSYTDILTFDVEDGATIDDPIQVDFNITDIMHNWNTGSDQYGVALKHDSGPAVGFLSYNAGYDHRPRITYRYYEGTSYQYVHYYDDSFAQKYVNQIDEAVAFVNKVYDDQFGVQYSTAQSPTRLDVSDCEHNSFYNVFSVLEKLKNLRSSSVQAYNQIVVLWSDRGAGYCFHEQDKPCALVDWEGASYKHEHAIHIMDLETKLLFGNTEDTFALMGILLAHETAHTRGMRDVYDDKSHDLAEGWRCVMEEVELDAADGNYSPSAFYNAILRDEANAFCDSCAAEMAS